MNFASLRGNSNVKSCRDTAGNGESNLIRDDDEEIAYPITNRSPSAFRSFRSLIALSLSLSGFFERSSATPIESREFRAFPRRGGELILVEECGLSVFLNDYSYDSGRRGRAGAPLLPLPAERTGIIIIGRRDAGDALPVRKG